MLNAPQSSARTRLRGTLDAQAVSSNQEEKKKPIEILYLYHIAVATITTMAEYMVFLVSYNFVTFGEVASTASVLDDTACNNPGQKTWATLAIAREKLRILFTMHTPLSPPPPLQC